MQREYDGEPIDMTWDNGPWANDGETIDATNDTNGTMKTIDWPDDATDPEELNEDQRDVIRAAARNPDIDNYAKIQEMADVDKAESYAAYTLRTHWPERYTRTKEPSPVLSDREVDKVRIALLNGETTRWLSDHFDVSQEAILRAARGGVVYNDVECKTPPLKHTTGNQGGEWVTKEMYEMTNNTDNDIEADADSTPRIKDPVAATTVDAFRKRALNGESATDIAKEMPNAYGADITRILKGEAVIDGSPTEPELEFNRAEYQWKPKTDDERIDAADQVDDDTEAEADDTADDADGDAEPDDTDTDPEPADIGWNPQPRQRQSNSKAIAALTAVVAIVAYLLGKRR